MENACLNAMKLFGGQPSLSLPVGGGRSCLRSIMLQPAGTAGRKPCLQWLSLGLECSGKYFCMHCFSQRSSTWMMSLWTASLRVGYASASNASRGPREFWTPNVSGSKGIRHFVPHALSSGGHTAAGQSWQCTGSVCTCASFPLCQYTFECRNDAVQYITVLHTTIQWQEQNIKHISKSQHTPHIQPLRASYGASFTRILEKYTPRYNGTTLYEYCFTSIVNHIVDIRLYDCLISTTGFITSFKRDRNRYNMVLL